MKLFTSLLLLSLPLLAPAKRVIDISHFKVGDGVELDKRDPEQVIIRPLFSEPKGNEILLPDGESPQDGPTLLTSGISTNKQISLFASYVRDNVEISQRFNSKNSQSIVFAPTDLAIEALSLKPWQFPTSLENAKSMSEKEVDQIVEANTNDFILSHIVDGTVPFSALKSNEKGVQLVTENGRTVKLVNDNGDYYVAAVNPGFAEDWIKVVNVVNVENGALLIISKTLSVPSV